MASIMSSSCPFARAKQARELSKWAPGGRSTRDLRAQLERKEPKPTKPAPACLGVPLGAMCPALPSSQWGSMLTGLRGEGECQGE